MTRLADSRDPNGIGMLILQHHDYDQHGYSLALRGGLLGVRVTDRDDRTGGLGSWLREKRKGDARASVGDLNGAFLWQPRFLGTNATATGVTSSAVVTSQLRARNFPGFAFAWPVVTQPLESNAVATQSSLSTLGCAIAPNLPSVLPIWEGDYSPDRRYQTLGLNSYPQRDGRSVWPKFPVDFFGIALTTSQEHTQTELFMPTDPRLIAVNRRGDALMGSLVCDMGDGFKVDTDRMARLQAMMQVVYKPTGIVPFPKNQNSIAWQIGPSGCGDSQGGFVFERRAGKASPPERPPIASVDERKPSLLDAVHALAQGIKYQPQSSAKTTPPLPIAGGLMPSKDPGVYALVSRFDSGPIDPGLNGDQHYIGSDKDGHSINACHLSTNSYFRESPYRDGPLEFGGGYIPPMSAPYLVHTFLRWDPRIPHAFIGGPRVGLWRWESECFFYLTTPPDKPKKPPPPPPSPPPDVPTTDEPPVRPPSIPPNVPTTGLLKQYTVDYDDTFNDVSGWASFLAERPKADTSLGIPPIRQWVPGDVPHSYAGTNLELAVPSLFGRPQDLSKDAPDLRRVKRSIPLRYSKFISQSTPITAHIEAYGAQGNSGIWTYNQKPRKGKYPGGTAAGGFAFMPPEFDMMDASSNFSRSGITAATTYFVAVPGAYWAAGIPNTSTGGVKSGYRWGIDSSGNLIFSRHDSSGTTTVGTTMEAGGPVSIPFGAGSGTGYAKASAAKSATTTSYTGGFGPGAITLYTLPANSFNSGVREIHAFAYGAVTPGAAFNLTLSISVGGQTAFTLALTDNSMTQYRISMNMWRDGTNSQRWSALLLTDATGSQGKVIQKGTTTWTDGSAADVSLGFSSANFDDSINRLASDVQFNN